MDTTDNSHKYSPEQIEEQKRYLSHAKGLDASERAIVLNKLNEGTMDSGVFGWVKCPIWRYRMYKIVEKKLLDEDTLDLIMQYILEGKKISDSKDNDSTAFNDEQSGK